MKRILILFAIVLLFSGGTAITKKTQKQEKSAISCLSEIACKMDSTSIKLDHSSAVLEKFQ